jgi:hypothetical protein
MVFAQQQNVEFYQYSPGSIFSARTSGLVKGVAFDGTNVWAATATGIDEISDPSAGVINTVGVAGAVQLAFDGTNIWSANGSQATVTKIQVSTASVAATYSLPASADDIVFDGQYIWVLSKSAASVTKLAGNGTIIGTFSTGPSPTCLVFDGANVWVGNSGNATLTKL